MTDDQIADVVKKALEFIGAHAVIQGGDMKDIGRICTALSATFILASSPEHDKANVARELTHAFMLDVETTVAFILANTKAPAP